MKKVILGALGAFVLFGGAFSLTAPSHAGDNDIPCPPIVAGPVHNNVVVRAGADCLIFRAEVFGNVRVEPGGRLSVYNSTIHGSIQSDGGHKVHVTGDNTGVMLVHGDIEVKNAPLPILASDFHTIRGSTIKGNIQFENNQVRVEVFGNVLLPLNVLLGANATGGNAQFYKNTGTGNVSGNAIAGNLECKDNVPPFIAAANVVEGNTECPG